MSKKMKRARVRFRSPAQLVQQKERLWEILSSMVAMQRREWEADFASTQLYAVFYDGKQIVGFTRVMEAEFTVEGRRVFTIGLGQALVLPAWRNQFLVQRALIYRWWRHFVRHPFKRIYIWGACISYKSYLSFTRVLREVHPRTGLPMRPEAATVIRYIGQHWYGHAFLPDSGCIRVKDLNLFDPEVQLQAGDLADADIAFYYAQLPRQSGEVAGLITVSPCVRSNFLPMAGSWIRNVFKRRKKKNARQRPH